VKVEVILALANAPLATKGMTPLREHRRADDPFIRRRFPATAWCARQAERSGMAGKPWRHGGMAKHGTAR
jgi:hypothetical protein